MEWNEYHHAWVVSEFYRLLLERKGEAGRRVFRQAAQTYGEQRGKRMAMRAMADGRPLGFLEYFAYGEYGSTDAFFTEDMWGEDGVVHEKVTRCPWADLFARRGMKDCGDEYCREIDRAIVRGFDPELELETASTQHYGGCCRFYFRQPGIPADTLERAEALTAGRTDLVMPLSYHCAHVFHVFSATARGAFGAEGEEMAALVLDSFGREYGPEMREALRAGAGAPFDTTLSLEEWSRYDTDRNCL